MASVAAVFLQPLTCLNVGDATALHNDLCNKQGVSLLKLCAIQ